MMIIDHPHRCVQWPRSKIICTKGSDMMIMGRGLHTNERAARSSQICAKDWNVFKTFVPLPLSTLDSSIRLSLIWMFSPSLKLGRRISWRYVLRWSSCPIYGAQANGKGPVILGPAIASNCRATASIVMPMSSSTDDTRSITNHHTWT